jgi:hypothetical protein
MKEAIELALEAFRDKHFETLCIIVSEIREYGVCVSLWA